MNGVRQDGLDMMREGMERRKAGRRGRSTKERPAAVDRLAMVMRQVRSHRTKTAVRGIETGGGVPDGSRRGGKVTAESRRCARWRKVGMLRIPGGIKCRGRYHCLAAAIFAAVASGRYRGAVATAQIRARRFVLGHLVVGRRGVSVLRQGSRRRRRGGG